MKKQLVILGAAAMVAAAAVPALAFENEFHGSYKLMGYQTNANIGGAAGFGLLDDSHSGWYTEQRARLMYIAKASDNLKLVTQFELDTRFGGYGSGYKGTSGSDSGNLDADQLTLETKSVYLDFKCPITGTNAKVGMQPFADAYNSLFILADMTGVSLTKKFTDPLTATAAWFRFDDNTVDYNSGPGQLSGDLFVLDGKFAINKDMKVGASYYYVHNDTPVFTTAGPIETWNEPRYENLHMIGLNADLTFGPANIKPFAAYQTGAVQDEGSFDLDAYLLGATAKIKAGSGAVNLAAIYLSGSDENDDDLKTFQPLTAGTTYFNPANMWLMIRPAQATHTSTSVLGNDMTIGGHGMWGVFAGYEGTADKLFYNANIGYGAAAETWNDEEASLGTEINAQVGYKLYDNLSISLAAAYMFLGDGLSGDDDERLEKGYGPYNTVTDVNNGGRFGAKDADDPYMMNVQLSYTF